MSEVREALAALLRDGIAPRAPHEDEGGWTVRRAWPARLTDPDAGVVLELAARRGPGRRGARLTSAGLEVLGADRRLPSLAARAAAGEEIVGLRPGKRAVLRTAEGTFVKLARPAATLGALEAMADVTGLLAPVPGAPRVPRALGGSAQQGVLELAPAPGLPLTRTLAADPEGEAAAVADVLVALTRVTRQDERLPTHTLDDEARVLERWAGAALALAPLTADEERALARVGSVAGRLRAAGRSPAPAVLAHRDLHEGQILRDGATTTLLDWDTAAWAHPAADLANLLAHLTRLGRLGALPADAVRRFRRALLAHLGRAGHPAVARRREQRVLALLCHATELRLVAVHGFRQPRGRSANR